MDDRQIRAHLDDLVKTEIPETMNLWHDLKVNLPAPRAARATRGLTLIAALAMMLLAGAAVFALVQGWTLHDPGLESARDADLFTLIGESQTVDDVTVTLDWAYADANRLAVGYSVTVPDAYEGAERRTEIALVDPANNFIAGASGVGWQGLDADDSDGLFGEEHVASFEVAFQRALPEALNLRLNFQVSIGAPPTQPGVLREDEVLSSGGGGGGSTNNGAAITAGSMQFIPEMVLDYEFTFTVPVIPAVVIEPDMTVEANGVTMTLTRISVTPTLTSVNLCYTLPSGRDWMPRAELTIDGTPYTHISWGRTGYFFPDATERCDDISFYAPYTLEPTPFTLRIETLYTPYSFTADRAELFVAQLAEQGITVEVTEANGEGFNYNILDFPETVDPGLAVQAAFDVFSDFHPGPWTFEVMIGE